MDADDLRAFDEDAAEAGEALWPAEVTIATVVYECEVTQPRSLGALVPGGEDLAADLVVRIRKSVLPTIPVSDSRLSYDGREWVIRTITGKNVADARWTLRCEPMN